MVEGGSLLHRAFSLFIFNNKGDLLLQKRSATKVKGYLLLQEGVLPR